jgi:CRISPR/Cas system CSM-associated protein Csm3 (group 7 of RAMP superfamily)
VSEEEGYEFAPLPERVHRAARPQAVHDRRIEGALSGVIEVVLRAEQPVHVGSGFKRLREDGKVVRRAAEVRGRPGIPGSSLKGVIRSRYEAITYSCAGPAPKGGKVRSQSYPDVKRASFQNQVRSLDVFDTRCDDVRSCAACALFGRMSQRSRVAVVDFAAEGGLEFSIDKMPEQFGPNAHHLGAFHLGKSNAGDNEFQIYSLRGRKFAAGQGPVATNARPQQIEVIPGGTRLRGQLRVSNVLPEELGGLLAALGELPSSALKVGAGKGQGFGRMVVEKLSSRLQDHMRAETFDAQIANTSWREAFMKCPDRWERGEQALISIHDRGC